MKKSKPIYVVIEITPGDEEYESHDEVSIIASFTDKKKANAYKGYANDSSQRISSSGPFYEVRETYPDKFASLALSKQDRFYQVMRNGKGFHYVMGIPILPDTQGLNECANSPDEHTSVYVVSQSRDKALEVAKPLIEAYLKRSKAH